MGFRTTCLVEIGSVILEKTIFKKIRLSIFTISLLFLLGKGRGLSLEQNWILFNPKAGWN